MTIAGAASRAALRAAGERVLLVEADGPSRTGRELEARVQALARALVERGLAGRRIGLWYWNSAAGVEAHLAVEWVAATRVPVDPGAPAAEAQAVFAAAEVEAVLVDGAHQQLAGALLHDEEESLAAPGSLEAMPVPPDRTALLYPRMAAAGGLLAVPISYANWAANIRLNTSLYRSGAYGPGFGDDERFLTAQQLPHGTGILGSFPFLHMGLPQVLLRRFDADAFVDAALRHRATATFFVPGMVTRLADALERSGRTAVPPLRRLLYGGAPIALDDLVRAVERIGSVLVQVYGRFEGGWPLAVLGVDDHARIAAGDTALAASCGRPVDGIEFRVRSVPGQPPGRGELSVRGATVVAQYADPDGWCALGDVAWLDEAGYLYLGGRLDGMINTGSYHVYPREVEEAIAAVPGVRGALVRGEPDPTWGEAVTAYVIPEDPASGEQLTERIRRALEARLARYKLPKRLYLVGSLNTLPPGPPDS
ncbi:MAG: class I adenylate-forming enzyme family protein [Actinomycetes bacterium]